MKQEDASTHNALLGIFGEQLDWLEKHANPTSTLYHYTTLNGLRGILESKCIWLSEFRCFKDKTEIFYGIDNIERMIRYMPLENAKKDVMNDVFEELRKLIIEKAEIYAGSFCVASDYLNMWRLFADDGKGFAIGFRSEFFIGATENKDELPSYGRSRIFYENREDSLIVTESEFEMQINNIVWVLIDAVKKAKNPGEFALLLQLFAVTLIPYILSLKNPEFEAEKEHRIYNLSDISDRRQKISVNGKKIITFNFDLNSILEIMIGPDSSYTKDQVKELFEELNISKEAEHIRITKSRHAYRS